MKMMMIVRCIGARNKKGNKSREAKTTDNNTVSGDMDVQAIESRASSINNGSTLNKLIA